MSGAGQWQNSVGVTREQTSGANWKDNPMEPAYWIAKDATVLLDVGCNTGELLVDCRRRHPALQLAGVDINGPAIELAKSKVPDAELHQALGFTLPFQDQRFSCVTCIEVIEHIPADHRGELIREMHRVLVPGGRLVLRCPHDGIFSWLDAQNFRFRFPDCTRRLSVEGGAT